MSTMVEGFAKSLPLAMSGVGVVRDLYAAVARHDGAAIRALLADDCVFHVPGKGRNAGTWHGPDGVLRFLAQAFELTGGSLTIELSDLLAGDEHVVALATYRGSRADRAPLVNRLAHVMRFEAGERSLRVRESWFCAYDQYAVDAFWS
ncbi:MAG: putative ketosteroid isomerase-related protein [Labilithrix sp.]|nr:putative ketosteroid isomerase-related protein [Labilithrix sp.]